MKRPFASTGVVDGQESASLTSDAASAACDASVAGQSARLKVLVTGGAGYVGRFLLPSLQEEGYDVVAVSRSSSPVALDITDGTKCTKVLADWRPDVILHAAANSSPANCENDPAGARAVNVPTDFVKAAREANPTVRFIFLSTDQVLNGKAHLADEAVQASPVNVYGRTKLDMENVVRDAFPQHAILRLSFIYGPTAEGAHATFLQFALDKVKAAKDFSVFTDQIRSAVCIDDVVETLKLAVAGRVTGLVNLGGPEPLSRFDFCKTVAEHLGANVETVKGNTYNLQVPSPADISMDTSHLTCLLGRPPLRLAEALSVMKI